MSIYAEAEAGIQTLPLDASVKQAALSHLKTWLEGEEFFDYRPQLEDLIRRKAWKLLADSFYQVLPFGTGGRRGPVGIGPNRFNPYTLASSVQGHAEYLKRQQKEKQWPEIAVVVAYDVRQFNDAKGLYRRDVSNPCLGKSSRDFARIAAGVYAANGIAVWILPEEATEVMSTPELSFSIRHLKAQGGLNISASHNPPDDNGAKVFNFTGGQEIPPRDEEMVKLVETVERVRQMEYKEACRAGWVRWIPEEARRAYLGVVKAVSLQPQYRDAVIVFSPLHGAGKHSLGRVLEEAGFRVIRVLEQWPDDSRFSAAPNGVPNPEERSAMERAIQLARETGADLALSTDPDADRIGAAAPDAHGVWRFLNGNEIATLLAQYILETRSRLGTLPKKPLIIKTEVTTRMLERLRPDDPRKVHLIGDLLVGFKYIGDVLQQIEETGAYQGESFTLDDFLLGTEESHGYLVTPAIRDKDAAGAGLLLAELAAVCKSRGIPLIEYLKSIYARSGLVRNFLVPTVMTGAEGTKRIQAIQESLRTAWPTTIGRRRVVSTQSHQDPNGRFGPIRSETDRSSRNVLVLGLEGGDRILLRPSGTEPKNKIYLEVARERQGAESVEDLEARVDAAIRQLADDFIEEMFRRIGLHLSMPARRVSGLVSLENKLDFDAFLAELERQTGTLLSGMQDEDALRSWARQRLKSYGLDPLPLVTEGVRSFVDQELPKADPARAECLHRMKRLFSG